MRTCHKFIFFESELVMRWSRGVRTNGTCVFCVRTGHEVESLE